MKPDTSIITKIQDRQNRRNRSMTMSISERWPVLANWRFFVIIVLPVVLSPLLFISDDDLVHVGTPEQRPATKFKCAYVIILMAAYWMVEAIPLAITSLLPIVLFPLLGVQDTGKVSINYMKETNMMFLGGLIIALSVEYCNLHKRVALRVMTLIGSSPVRLMLGVMMTTMFLSMWISNTATTAMMVPIVLAVLEELGRDTDSKDSKREDHQVSMSGTKEGSDDEEKDVGVLERRSRNNEYDEKFSEGSLYVSMAQNEEEVQNGSLRSDELRKQLLFGVICGANIGGLFWPYTSVTSSVLYRLSERFGKGILLSVACASNIGGTGFLTGTAANIILKSRIDEAKLERSIVLEKMYLLSIAYSTNIGGTGVITGSAPNLVLQEFLKDENIGQNGKYTDLTFATWMAFNIPAMLINVFIAWIYLTLVFFGRPSWLKFGKGKSTVASLGDTAKSRDNVTKLLKQKYADLGPMTFHEKWVGGLFFCVVLLWLFRDPKIIKGWAEYIEFVDVGDSTAAMLVVLLLFIIPRSLNFFTEGASGSLLEWKYVQDNLPWGIILLMGGGFALSDASAASGLSLWLGEQLNALESLDRRVILIVVMLMTAFVTEIASNTACANVIIPILLSLSRNLNIHPLYLTLPATVTCSYAFMLPVATPPNAIVFGATKNMNILDMVKSGIFLNFSCVIVLFLINISYGNFLFDYSNYVYANSPNITSS